jgi:hypothetical protein
MQSKVKRKNERQEAEAWDEDTIEIDKYKKNGAISYDSLLNESTIKGCAPLDDDGFWAVKKD